MPTQNITYYKNSTRSTRFIKETGELLHVLIHNNDTNVSFQIIDESHRDAMILALASNNNISTAEEFNVTLEAIKTLIDNL
jgi:hypothetical protein